MSIMLYFCTTAWNKGNNDTMAKWCGKIGKILLFCFWHCKWNLLRWMGFKAFNVFASDSDGILKKKEERSARKEAKRKNEYQYQCGAQINTFYYMFRYIFWDSEWRRIESSRGLSIEHTRNATNRHEAITILIIMIMKVIQFKVVLRET